MIVAASNTGSGDLVLPVAILVISVLYFVPSIVAIIRKQPNMASIVVVNFFLGWTFIGWVISLAMAVR